jgi:hypothetical protein
MSAGPILSSTCATWKYLLPYSGHIAGAWAGATVIRSVAVRNDGCRQGHLFWLLFITIGVPADNAEAPCDGRRELCMSMPFWALALIGFVASDGDKPSFDNRVICYAAVILVWVWFFTATVQRFCD